MLDVGGFRSDAFTFLGGDGGGNMGLGARYGGF